MGDGRGAMGDLDARTAVDMLADACPWCHHTRVDKTPGGLKLLILRHWETHPDLVRATVRSVLPPAVRARNLSN